MGMINYFMQPASPLCRRLLFAFLLLLGTSLPARADEAPAPHHPGVDVAHYAFQLGLTDQSNRITGEATVEVRFTTDTLRAFHLDLVGQDAPQARQGMEVTAVTRNGKDVTYQHEEDRLHIRLASPPQLDERRTYTVSYRGVPADGLIIADNKYGDRTFFGDNWPNRARHWLPTVDHPADKATVEFSVTAPAHYQVISNGRMVEKINLPDDLRLTHWRSTAPLPTKVMVIGAARFAIDFVDEHEGVPIQSWVFPQARQEGFHDFARAERILKFYEGHIGPFPYAKLANVQSNTRYGGMENASAIFYNQDAVTGTRQNEPLLAHEIAHQWFGNSVTETNWSHLWLSEGFATYLTHLYLEFAYGRDRLVRGLLRDRRRILEYRKKAPDAPLVDTTYTDPLTLLNAYSYQKGGWVLHMLRYVVGEEAFWDGLSTFYRRYRGGNAETRDFREIMEKASGQDLSRFFHQWTREAGLPHYEGGWTYDEETNQLTVTLNQPRPRDPIFRMPIELGIYTDDATSDPRIEVMDVDDRQNTFTFEVAERPAEVRLDPNTWVLKTADFENGG